MKNIVKFLKDRRGVSPVIGVILMVAITVILGAVVAAFAYGYVGDMKKAPQIVLSAMDDPKDHVSLLIKHNGGEEIAIDDWSYSVTAGKDTTTTLVVQDAAIGAGTVVDASKVTTSGTANITAGWYRVVVVYVPNDSALLDTNVLVR